MPALLGRVAGAQRAEVRQLAAQQLRKCIARFWRRLEPQVPHPLVHPQSQEQPRVALSCCAFSSLGLLFGLYSHIVHVARRVLGLREALLHRRAKQPWGGCGLQRATLSMLQQLAQCSVIGREAATRVALSLYVKVPVVVSTKRTHIHYPACCRRASIGSMLAASAAVQRPVVRREVAAAIRAAVPLAVPAVPPCSHNHHRNSRV